MSSDKNIMLTAMAIINRTMPKELGINEAKPVSAIRWARETSCGGGRRIHADQGLAQRVGMQQCYIKNQSA